jgi:hypothetical protein
MADKGLYLGRLFDPQKNNVTVQSVDYDPADLTTHAVVTGMTGSGKTGLCINLLEEAALQGIPAIIIDPKGDLTNLLLHFPELAPIDFQPWIDPEIARRAGETVEQASGAAALAWRKGLQEWGIDHERMLALKNAAEFAIYTPGSDSGIPVSVLSSLDAPELDWNSNREVLREKISSTVTALLGLVGIQDVDPIQSREHILLSNLFEDNWSQGKNVDLTELILQTQTPPFEKLGAFPVDTFFPPKERMSLAMQLNNILAAPAFEAWREGQSIDVSNLLYAKDGRPRHSIFYLAHLSDPERMFFVTLLFSSIETWMRTQTGTGSLRAILYMDELFGYLPPTANPPSKEPLLRMLKQGRAFGLGLLLATQNPVDVDYKALSNAGTWFIGKLQTDQDKQRLLDGLMSASGGTPRAALDQLISRLAKRVFVLHNVHARQPRLFQTRWTMNFLAGPMTRAQIPALNQLVGAKNGNPATERIVQVPVTDQSSKGSVEPAKAQPAALSPVEEHAAVAPTRLPVETVSTSAGGNQTKPSLPAGIAEYFLPQTFSLPEAFSEAKEPMPPEAMLKDVIYRPALLASAQIRFLDRKLGVDSNLIHAVLVEKMAHNSAIQWGDYVYKGPALEKIGSEPAPGARFGMIDPPLNDSKRMAAMQKDFTDWVYRNSSVKARVNQALKVFAGPDVTQADFMKACADAARAARDAELEKSTGALDRKIKSLEEKIDREERELQQDQTELNQRKTEEFGNLAELGASLVGIGRKKSLTTQLTKRRLTEQAKGNVEDSIQAIDQYKKDLSDLQSQRAETSQEIGDRWGKVVNDVASVDVNPKKTDIYVNLFGVAWVPYYLIQSGGQVVELRAFGAE